MTDDELRSTALAILARELGPAGLIRFLQQFDQGEGDYTAERHRWLDGLTMDDILADIEKLRSSNNGN
jgi:hypothetical protein